MLMNNDLRHLLGTIAHMLDSADSVKEREAD